MGTGRNGTVAVGSERIAISPGDVLVADRPGRIEPREIKRRRQTYKNMEQPRAALRTQLLERN